MENNTTKAVFILCSCGEKHRLIPGTVKPVYWCDQQLKELQEGDIVETEDNLTMQEKIAQALSRFNGFSDWVDFDKSMRIAYLEFANIVLGLETTDCRLAVVEKEGELPKARYKRANLGDDKLNGWAGAELRTRQDMLGAGYVQEKVNNVRD